MDEASGAEGPQHSGGPELSEGVEHLQRAARELVAAARSFLDVVEQVVEDDERLSGAASSIAELVGRGLGSTTGRDLASGLLGGLSGREPAWLRNDPDHPDAPDHSDDPDHQDDADPYFGDASVDLTVVRDVTDDLVVDDTASEPARTAPARAASTTPRTRRVTRISVD